MLLRLVVVCDIANFGYNGATVYILIGNFLHPCGKSSSILSCFMTRIIIAPSSSSKLLSHFYRRDADLSASIEPP